MTRVLFDFKNDGLNAFHTLDAILYSSGRKSLHISPELMDLETRFLFELLHHQAVKIYKCDCLFKNQFTEEFSREADSIAHLLNKRSVTWPLYNALHILSDYKPEYNGTQKGVMFYPELKAYLRCGDLSPQKMFELFATGDCDKIILFHDTAQADEPILPHMDVYYIIQNTLPSLEITRYLQETHTENLRKVMEALKVAEPNER